MAALVLMPKSSDTMTEGRVLRWLKREGDHVARGEPVVEIETDKVDIELEAPGEGVLLKILASEASTVPIGQALAVIGAADEDISGLLTNVVFGGSSAVQHQTSEPLSASSSTAGTVNTSGRVGERVFASPLARRLAKSAGIDLRHLSGSGPDGRIIRPDVNRAIAAGSSITALSSDAVLVESDFYEEPLSAIRKAIAARLVQSLGPVPHFYLSIEVDMRRAIELRESANALDPQLRLSFNDIIIKACASALQIHPELNASFMGDRIRTFSRVHIGIAVALETGGLITPVLRDCHRKDLRQISREARELVVRARDRKLAPFEYTGATFTVSNLGMLGIDEFSAIINPPEAAILAVGAIVQKPVVNEGQIEIGNRCRMTLSCDHRVLDGATGANFLNSLRGFLENPDHLGRLTPESNG